MPEHYRTVRDDGPPDPDKHPWVWVNNGSGWHHIFRNNPKLLWTSGDTKWAPCDPGPEPPSPPEPPKRWTVADCDRLDVTWIKRDGERMTNGEIVDALNAADQADDEAVAAAESNGGEDVSAGQGAGGVAESIGECAPLRMCPPGPPSPADDGSVGPPVVGLDKIYAGLFDAAPPALRPMHTLPDGHDEWVLTAFSSGEWGVAIRSAREWDKRYGRVGWLPLSDLNLPTIPEGA